MLGKPVKDFSRPATGGGTFRLAEKRGKALVVRFHPKDNTPGIARRGAGLQAIPRHQHPEVRDFVKTL